MLYLLRSTAVRRYVARGGDVGEKRKGGALARGRRWNRGGDGSRRPTWNGSILEEGERGRRENERSWMMREGNERNPIPVRHPHHAVGE